jgi:hypothetical protein
LSWGVACGVKDFRERYEQNLLDSTFTILEGDELASAIKALLDGRRQPWDGTATQLGAALKRFGFVASNPRALSARLRRLAPALRNGYAIEVAFLPRNGEQRLLRLAKLPPRLAST